MILEKYDMFKRTCEQKLLENQSIVPPSNSRPETVNNINNNNNNVASEALGNSLAKFFGEQNFGGNHGTLVNKFNSTEFVPNGNPLRNSLTQEQSGQIMSPLASNYPPIQMESMSNMGKPMTSSYNVPVNSSQIATQLPDDDYHNHLPLTKRISRQVNQMNNGLNSIQNPMMSNQPNLSGGVSMSNIRTHNASTRNPANEIHHQISLDSNRNSGSINGLQEKSISNESTNDLSMEKLQQSRRDLELLTSAANHLLKSSGNDDTNGPDADSITRAAQELQKSIVQFLHSRQSQGQPSQSPQPQPPPPRLFTPTSDSNSVKVGNETQSVLNQNVQPIGVSQMGSVGGVLRGPPPRVFDPRKVLSTKDPNLTFVTNPNLPELPALEKVQNTGYLQGVASPVSMRAASVKPNQPLPHAHQPSSSTTTTSRTRTISLPASDCIEIKDLLASATLSSHLSSNPASSVDRSDLLIPSLSANKRMVTPTALSNAPLGVPCPSVTQPSVNILDKKYSQKRPVPALTSKVNSETTGMKNSSPKKSALKADKTSSAKRRKQASNSSNASGSGSVFQTSSIAITATATSTIVSSDVCTTASTIALRTKSSTTSCSSDTFSAISSDELAWDDSVIRSQCSNSNLQGKIKRNHSASCVKEAGKEKGSARREERMKRLSMLFPDTDVDKRRNEERLQMLKVRFVEEVTEQTSVDTQKTNIIHSGQFMSSRVWSNRGKTGEQQNQLKILKELKSNFFPSLKNLFTHIINKAYHVRQLISPKWKQFRGIDLDVPCKVRLNNLIWRCWHLQFSKRSKHPMCRFIVPNEKDHNHLDAQAHVLEGKYWRRQDSAVISEYMSWRWYYKIRNEKCPRRHDFDTKRFAGLQFPKQHHNLPETFVGGRNADFIQNSLSQFHLVLPVDLMDIEPFQPMTPLNFDLLDDFGKIGFDVSEADKNSTTSNFFSPMHGESENLASVERLDSVTAMSSIDSNEDPSGLLKDAPLSLSPPEGEEQEGAPQSSLSSNNSHLSNNSLSGANQTGSPGFLQHGLLESSDVGQNDALLCSNQRMMCHLGSDNNLRQNNWNVNSLKVEPETSQEVVYLDGDVQKRRNAVHRNISADDFGTFGTVQTIDPEFAIERDCASMPHTSLYTSGMSGEMLRGNASITYGEPAVSLQSREFPNYHLHPMNQSETCEESDDGSDSGESGSDGQQDHLLSSSSQMNPMLMSNPSSNPNLLTMQSHVPSYSGSINGPMSVPPQLSQMQQSGSLLHGQLNAMLAAYPYALSHGGQNISNVQGLRGAVVEDPSLVPATSGHQLIFNGQGGQPSMLSPGGQNMLHFQGTSSIGPAPHIVTPGTPSGNESSPIALLLSQQRSQYQQQGQMLGSHLPPESPLQRFMPTTTNGGGNSTEAAAAAASISQNAPMLKGILGQVHSPSGTSTSSGRPGSSFVPPGENKQVDHDEMKSVYDSIDPSVVKYQRLRDKTAEELTLHKERREKVHQMSERKRRHNIQVALNSLQEKLPPNSEHSKQCKTRAVILTRAQNYIESMEEERDTLRRTIFQLRSELGRVNHDIRQIHQLLPTDQAGLPEDCTLPEQTGSVMRQQFQNYLSENSQHGWSFFIFSHLARRFFESFVSCVRLQSFDRFSESVASWVQHHCTMVNIRGVVTESLTEMCGKEMPYASTSSIPTMPVHQLYTSSQAPPVATALAATPTSTLPLRRHTMVAPIDQLVASTSSMSSAVSSRNDFG